MEGFSKAPRRCCSVFSPLLSVLVLLVLAQSVQGQFDYITNNGEITITGYSGPGGDVTIPTTINDLPVTTIGSNAFAYSIVLTNVFVPASVRDIQDWAFYSCSMLSGVTVSNGLSTIGQGAWWGCNRLADLTLPGSVRNIGDGAFAWCTALTNVTIPSGVTNIATYAFAYCSSLQLVAILGDLSKISYEMFYGCGQLASISIPAGVRSIDPWAFYYCTNLAAIILPGNLTNIGGGAFSTCSNLRRITIPASVVRIASFAFEYCGRLNSVLFEGNAPSTIESLAFRNDFYLTVYYLPGTTGWGTTVDGHPALLWNPTVLTTDPTFGVRSNRFGFTVTGTSNLTVRVEACTNLAEPAWVRVWTGVLGQRGAYFSDSGFTNLGCRFYRIPRP